MFDTLQNKARKANQQAMVAEKKRTESPSENRCVPKQKWLEDMKKIGNLVEWASYVL
jgi:pre-mRNA-splicing factor SYF2